MQIADKHMVEKVKKNKRGQLAEFQMADEENQQKFNRQEKNGRK